MRTKTARTSAKGTRMSTGTSRPRGRVLALWVSAGVLLLSLPLADAADKSKRAEEPYGLVTGTVFQESGYVLRGAEITVKPAPEGKPAARIKTATAFSDMRGEFAIRVPAVEMRYIVSVKAPGFQTQDKTVTVNGDERLDLFFRLEPEPVRK
jgi:hypothetical protein